MSASGRPYHLWRYVPNVGDAYTFSVANDQLKLCVYAKDWAGHNFFSDAKVSKSVKITCWNDKVSYTGLYTIDDINEGLLSVVLTGTKQSGSSTRGTKSVVEEVLELYHSYYINLEFDSVELTGGGPVSDGANVGVGEGTFKQKNVDVLEFKSLSAGENVTVSADADTITISAPHTLGSHSNISTGVDAPSADGQVLRWKQGAGEWYASDPPTSTLGELSNVNPGVDTGVAPSGSGLVWNGVEWSWGTPTPAQHTLLGNQHSDAVPDGPLTDGQLIVYDGASNLWKNKDPTLLDHNLTTHTDVTITFPVFDKEVLTWDNSIGQWVNEAPQPTDWTAITNKPTVFPPDDHALGDHTDVIIDLPADNQVLTYNSGQWINADPQSVPHILNDHLDTAFNYPLAEGELVTWDNTASKWVNLPPALISINTLTDVNTTGVADGDILQYNNGTSNFEPVALSTALGHNLVSDTHLDVDFAYTYDNIDTISPAPVNRYKNTTLTNPLTWVDSINAKTLFSSTGVLGTDTVVVNTKTFTNLNAYTDRVSYNCQTLTLAGGYSVGLVYRDLGTSIAKWPMFFHLVGSQELTCFAYPGATLTLEDNAQVSFGALTDGIGSPNIPVATLSNVSSAFIVMTVSATGTIKIYLNGLLYFTSIDSTTCTNITRVDLGAHSGNGIYGSLIKLGELIVWDDELTSEQVAGISNALTSYFDSTPLLKEGQLLKYNASRSLWLPSFIEASEVLNIPPDTRSTGALWLCSANATNSGYFYYDKNVSNFGINKTSKNGINFANILGGVSPNLDPMVEKVTIIIKNTVDETKFTILRINNSTIRIDNGTNYTFSPIEFVCGIGTIYAVPGDWCITFIYPSVNTVSLLKDTTITGVPTTQGQVLQYDYLNSKWVNNHRMYGQCYFSSNVSTITLTTVGTFYPVTSIVTSFQGSNGVSMPSNGRLRYTGTGIRSFRAVATISAICQTNDEIHELRIMRENNVGTDLDDVLPHQRNSYHGARIQNTVISGMVTLNQNEGVRVDVSNTESGNKTITIVFFGLELQEL